MGVTKEITLKKVTSSLLVACFVGLTISAPTSALASASWAKGTIDYIYITSDGFIVALNGNALDNCQYNRVNIKVSQHTDKLVDRIYAAALAAQAADRQFEIVIDIAINGVGGACDAVNGSTIIRS